MDFRILEICKERGITQKALSEQIGLSAVGLSKAINGNPTIGTLEKIAEALNVKVSDLMKEERNAASLTCPKCGAELELRVKE